MTNDNTTIVEYLLSAPDSQLDNCMKPIIKNWSHPPTPLQVLEVLDKCIHGSLVSGFVITLLESMYDLSCRDSNTSHEEVVKDAKWRL